MKRNVFWTIWGVVSLVCLMMAGYKSFALEIEKNNQSTKPAYLNESSDIKNR